jgi:hypothetical protein
MSDDDKKKIESLNTMACRLQVARGRLRIFAKTMRER